MENRLWKIAEHLAGVILSTYNNNKAFMLNKNANRPRIVKHTYNALMLGVSENKNTDELTKLLIYEALYSYYGGCIKDYIEKNRLYGRIVKNTRDELNKVINETIANYN